MPLPRRSYPDGVRTYPPPIRGSAWQPRREDMSVPRYQCQVGCSPYVAADAQVGFSATACRPADILFELSEGNPRILVRIEDACARTRKAGENGNAAQRAKVGSCPCCARPAHIAVLARYEVGELSPEDAREISLRMEQGPRAARCYAARLFAQHLGYIPAARDWAAQSLNLRAPPLSDGVFGSARERSSPVPPPSGQVDYGPNPKLNVHSNAGVSPPDDDLFTRPRQPSR